MTERTLVPLDGSKIGEAALLYVEGLVSRLAPGEKVEVTLFQVISPPTHRVETAGEIFDVPYTEEEIELVKKKVLDYLDKAGEGLRSKGAIVRCKVGVGEAAEEIIKAEGEINADLVAMSTHGRSGISRWAFGSVADKVLRAGKVPVLIVRVSKEATQT